MDPLVLTIVTGVGFALATTAIVLAGDASARTVGYPAEDVVPNHAILRGMVLIEIASTETIGTRRVTHESASHLLEATHSGR
jgi:hypothetical protein